MSNVINASKSQLFATATAISVAVLLVFFVATVLRNALAPGTVLAFSLQFLSAVTLLGVGDAVRSSLDRRSQSARPCVLTRPRTFMDDDPSSLAGTRCRRRDVGLSAHPAVKISSQLGDCRYG
jgi:hypothetical protein